MTEFKKEKEVNKIKKIQINLKIFNRLLYLAIIILGVYYIGAANDLTVKGFELQRLKKELINLQETNNKSELQVMSMDSYGNLNDRIKNLNMVAVGKIDYIKNYGSAMAKK